jgi:WD40 repeat protein
MAINSNLLAVLKEIVSRHGGVETLSNARRVKALLSDLAADEPKRQKKALIACLEHGFVALLQEVPARERGHVKEKMAERLNREEGLDLALCSDTLDLLEAALLIGNVSPKPAPKITAAPKTDNVGGKGSVTQSAPEKHKQQPAPQDSEVWRELRTLKGHTGEVRAVAYNPDGSRIVSGSSDTTIKIWDAENGWERRTLTGHTLPVNSVAYSPDGRRIASGSRDNTVKIWDAESGRKLRTLEGHTSTVKSVAYSPDGRRIVSGSSDKTVRIWDTEGRRELLKLKRHTGPVLSVAYSPDGRRIVSGGDDKTIRIWDAESGRELRTLKGHTDWVFSVAYSPDGRGIASGSSDKTIRICDRKSVG